MGPQLDVRELVYHLASTRASRNSGNSSVTVQQLQAVYEIDDQLGDPAPTSIAVVDDMLTAGTDFRAMHSLLSARFPDVPIIGLFIARRVFPGPKADDFGFALIS